MLIWSFLPIGKPNYSRAFECTHLLSYLVWIAERWLRLLRDCSVMGGFHYGASSIPSWHTQTPLPVQIKNGLYNSKLSSWKRSPPTFAHVNQDFSLSRSKNQPYGSVSVVKISSDAVRGSGRDKHWWINLTSNSNVINAEWYELPLTENFRICRVDKLSCHTQSRPPD